MNKLNLIAAAATLAGAILSPLPAAANNSQDSDIETGVVCRPTTEAEFHNGVLRCSKPRTVELESICSGVTLSGTGEIGGNIRVLRLTTAGVDQCVGPLGVHADSVMRPPLPGLDPAALPGVYTRVVNPSGPDKFTAQQKMYEYPQGRLFVGDASRGVGCSNGFTATSTSHGRGLACVKQGRAVDATCDGGFSIKHVDGVDKCTKTDRDFFGNLVVSHGQYTIPKGVGYMGFMGNPANHGWKLKSDAEGHADQWEPKEPQYAYATAR
jgi:hypothetical protein